MATIDSKDVTETPQAESLRTEIINYFVSCPLCLEEYKDPTDLPCMHTFCKGCLKTYISDLIPGSKFLCPMCQKGTEVPKDGLKGFTHNFFIESLQDTVHVLQSTHNQKCDFCALTSQTETVATSKCINCHDYLCERCSILHCGTKFTRDHKVLTFQQLQSKEYQKEIQEQQKIFCPEHKDEVIRYFCSDCNVPICHDCKDLHHDSHKLISLEKAAEMVKPQMQTKFYVIERKLAKGEKTLVKIDATLAKLQENESSVQLQIKARAAHLRQIVDQQEKTLLQELHKTTSAHRNHLQASHMNCSATCSSIKTTTAAVKNILQHGAPIDVLMLQHQLGQRLDELQSTSAVEEIPEELNLKLSTTTEVDQEISSGAGLGNVQISRQPALPKFKPQAECMLEFDTDMIPVDISVSQNREYVTTHGINDKVKVLRSDGMLGKGITSVSDTQLKCPVGICHFPDGRMVLSGADNNKLFILSPHWEVQQTVDVNNPLGVALNDNCTKIAVAQGDREKSVSVFSIDIKGKITLTKVIKDKDGKQLFNSPNRVAYMSNGCLIVSDELPNKLHILTPSGDPLYQYTGPENKLGRPFGVCVDAYHNILVSDHDNNCIHLVSQDGKFIQYVATEADGLYGPWACTINQEGDLVVTQRIGILTVFQYLEI